MNTDTDALFIYAIAPHEGVQVDDLPPHSTYYNYTYEQECMSHDETETETQRQRESGWREFGYTPKIKLPISIKIQKM